MKIAGNRPNDQSAQGDSDSRTIDAVAADALARAADLWARRLADGWAPPEGEDGSGSTFPWAMVKLSLGALLPGLREWGRVDSPLPPSPSPRFAGGEGESGNDGHLPLSKADGTDKTPPLPQRSGERGKGGEGNPKRIALILAGNTPLLAWSPLAACLLAGHVVEVKMSRAETLWPRLFRDALADVAPEVATRIRLHEWPGDDPRTAALVASADAVIAYGSDETIAVLRALMPTATPFFGYGYGVSVGLLPCNSRNFPARDFANDVLLYDQAGCLSPQALLVERTENEQWFRAVSDSLPLALSQAVRRFDVPPVSEPTVARRIRGARDMALFSGATVLGDEALRWTILIYDEPAPLTLPTGHGVITVMPVHDAVRDFGNLLGALRGHLSSVCVTGKLANELRAVLLAEGASRLCAFGKMQTPPLDWPNGNQDLLAELLRL